MTGQTDNGYSIRQGAYDLRKLRGKNLVAKRSRPPPRASRCRPRTVAALLAIRDLVKRCPSWGGGDLRRRRCPSRGA